jgi:hypothetical protein
MRRKFGFFTALAAADGAAALERIVATNEAVGRGVPIPTFQALSGRPPETAPLAVA